MKLKNCLGCYALAGMAALWLAGTVAADSAMPSCCGGMAAPTTMADEAKAKPDLLATCPVSGDCAHLQGSGSEAVLLELQKGFRQGSRKIHHQDPRSGQKITGGRQLVPARGKISAKPTMACDGGCCKDGATCTKDAVGCASAVTIISAIKMKRRGEIGFHHGAVFKLRQEIISRVWFRLERRAAFPVRRRV